MYEARLKFNSRREVWELWFDELQVMTHPDPVQVREWAGRHNYTIAEEAES